MCAVIDQLLAELDSALAHAGNPAISVQFIYAVRYAAIVILGSEIVHRIDVFVIVRKQPGGRAQGLQL